jgi:hypothetical protein
MKQVFLFHMCGLAHERNTSWLLWTWWWTFRFFKRWESSCLAERLLAHQEGLCSVVHKHGWYVYHHTDTICQSWQMQWNITVFWDMISCSLIGGCKHFRGTSWLKLQHRQRWQVPTKHWYPSTKPHRVTSLKSVILTHTSITTSYLTRFNCSKLELKFEQDANYHP